MKKIIALLLVAVMAIGFCACAAKTETPDEPATTETTTTEARKPPKPRNPQLKKPRPKKPPKTSISTN